MKKIGDKRSVRLLFLITIPLLFLHFAFAIIIREPYPSAIMPGFAGVKSEAKKITTSVRKIISFPSDGDSTFIAITDVFQNISPVGTNRILDRMLFNTNEQQRDHPARKKYDRLLSNILGVEFMQKAISLRSRISSENEINEFKDWIHHRVDKLNPGSSQDSILVLRYNIVQDIETRQELDRIITHKVRVY